MDELAALVETAGGEAVITLIQNRPAPEPRSFIGDGKIAEMKQLIAMHGCDMAVFDNELSPSQMRVLSEELSVKVLDRSGLILDIFAGRALKLSVDFQKPMLFKDQLSMLLVT